MNVEQHLKRALTEYADEVPAAGTVATAELAGRIRRGRALRQVTVVAAAAIVMVLIVYGTTTGVRALGGRDSRPGDSVPPPGPPLVVNPDCDRRVTGVVPVEGPLSMTATIPPVTAATSTQASIRVTVTVTNRSGARLTGSTTAHPDMVVVRGGGTVATPADRIDAAVPVALAPGASMTFDAPLLLQRCAELGATTPAGPLPPGTYEVYAIQTYQLQGLEPNEVTTRVQGGPWLLALS